MNRGRRESQAGLGAWDLQGGRLLRASDAKETDGGKDQEPPKPQTSTNHTRLRKGDVRGA